MSTSFLYDTVWYLFHSTILQTLLGLFNFHERTSSDNSRESIFNRCVSIGIKQFLFSLFVLVNFITNVTFVLKSPLVPLLFTIVFELIFLKNILITHRWQWPCKITPCSFYLIQNLSQLEKLVDKYFTVRILWNDFKRIRTSFNVLYSLHYNVTFLQVMAIHGPVQRNTWYSTWIIMFCGMKVRRFNFHLHCFECSCVLLNRILPKVIERSLRCYSTHVR